MQEQREQILVKSKLKYQRITSILIIFSLSALIIEEKPVSSL